MGIKNGVPPGIIFIYENLISDFVVYYEYITKTHNKHLKKIL